MPSILLRLAVALLTFGLGVSATMFWIVYRKPEIKLPAFEHKKKSCGMSHLVPPLPPMPPLPKIDEPPPSVSLRTRAQVSAGAIDRKALKKPLPLYPSPAGAARASGDVLVEILVDETGKVIAANALSGHPLLRQAAMQAAYEAEFAPILLSGQAVMVYGTLSYNFASR